MPRHSYRKSISKPFLPLARALSLPKQDRGISNTSIRATIVRETLAAYENGDLTDEKPVFRAREDGSAALSQPSSPDAPATQTTSKPSSSQVKKIAPLSPENWPLAIKPATKPDIEEEKPITAATTVQKAPRAPSPGPFQHLASANPQNRIPASRRIPTGPPSIVTLSASASSAASSSSISPSAAELQSVVLHSTHQRRSKSMSGFPFSSKPVKLDMRAERVDENHQEVLSGQKNSRKRLSSQHARFRSASVGNLPRSLSIINEEGGLQPPLPTSHLDGRPFMDDDEDWQLLTLKLRKGVPLEQGKSSRTRLLSAFDTHHITEHLSLPSFLQHPPPPTRTWSQRRKGTRKRHSSANDAAASSIASMSPVIPLPRSPTAADVWSIQLQDALQHAGDLSSSSSEDDGRVQAIDTLERKEASNPGVALHWRGMSSCPELSLAPISLNREPEAPSLNAPRHSLDSGWTNQHSRCQTSSTERDRTRSRTTITTQASSFTSATAFSASSSSKKARSDGHLPLPQQRGSFLSAFRAQDPSYNLGLSSVKGHITFASYTYGVDAPDTREPLMLLPRDLNQDLHVKPWMVTLPQRLLAERKVGVRDWDRDRLENWYKAEEGPCVRLGRVKCREGCREPNCGDVRARCIASTLIL